MINRRPIFQLLEKKMDLKNTIINTLLNENDENSLPAHLQQHYQMRDGRIIPKIDKTMSPHDHGYDYTHGTIEDAKTKGEIHRNHKEILKDNPHPKGSKEHSDWQSGVNKAKEDVLKDWN